MIALVVLVSGSTAYHDTTGLAEAGTRSYSPIVERRLSPAGATCEACEANTRRKCGYDFKGNMEQNRARVERPTVDISDGPTGSVMRCVRACQEGSSLDSFCSTGSLCAREKLGVVSRGSQGGDTVPYDADRLTPRFQVVESLFAVMD